MIKKSKDDVMKEEFFAEFRELSAEDQQRFLASLKATQAAKKDGNHQGLAFILIQKL